MATQRNTEVKICKKSWTSVEDAHLLKLVDQYGLNGHWTTISGEMQNRTGKQCRERYHNHLRPGIDKTQWTKEEDDLLNESQRQLGNQWEKIAKLIPGRSDNNVKNRWHIINRKKNESTLSTSKRPVIPKLSLGNLGGAATCTPNGEAVEDDLLSFFYSHDSHCHEATNSTRTDKSNEFARCPGSGRRDATTTEAAPYDLDFSDPFDSLLDTAIDVQSRQMECMSFNNTLASNISELTTGTMSGDMQGDITFMEPEDDSWIDDIMDNTARSDIMNNDEEQEGRDGQYLQNSSRATTVQVCDRFSEAALSFRDMDSVLDDLAQQTMTPHGTGFNNNHHRQYDLDNDEEDTDVDHLSSEGDDLDDDLFLFNDLESISSVNTGAHMSWESTSRGGADSTGINNLCSFDSAVAAKAVVPTLHKSFSFNKTIVDFGRYKNSLAHRISPRLTPRSPGCYPHQIKRQRGGHTPRSPFHPFTTVK